MPRSDAASNPSSAEVILGIFVGGESRRMLRHPKGCLLGPDHQPLLARLLELGAREGLDVVLVGDATPYRSLAPHTPALTDAIPGSGPLGGLVALLERAGDRHAIALSCDLPFVDASVLRTLRDHAPHAAMLCARAGDGAPFEPLVARYDAPRALPEARARLLRGDLSLQRLAAALDATWFLPEDPKVVRDWDTPDDVREGGGSFGR